MSDSEPTTPTASIAPEPTSPVASIASVSVMASLPHPTNPNSVIFTVPNMNHSLHIKLSKGMAWRTQILAYIRGQDAFKFVDGSSQPLVQILPNSSTAVGAPTIMVNPEYLAWCQRDQMILSVLISTITKPYVVHAVGCATATALWTTLVTMFASQARACVMQIYFQLATVKKGINSITKTLSDTLATAGQPLNDFERVSFLLKGLGTEFDPFVTSVTTRVDPLSIDELYGHLLAHEMRIVQQLPSIDLAQPSANYSSQSPMPKGKGYRGRDSSSGGHNFRCRGSSSSNHRRGSYFNNDPAPSSRPIC